MSSVQKISKELLETICLEHELYTTLGFLKQESREYETVLDVFLECLKNIGTNNCILKLLVSNKVINLRDITLPPPIGPEEEDRFFNGKKKLTNYTQLLIWVCQSSDENEILKFVIQNLDLKQSEWIKILKSIPNHNSFYIFKTYPIVDEILKVYPSLVKNRKVQKLFMLLVSIFSHYQKSLNQSEHYNVLCVYLSHGFLTVDNVDEVFNILLNPILTKNIAVPHLGLNTVMINTFRVIVHKVISDLPEKVMMRVMYKILRYVYDRFDFSTGIIPKNVLSRMDLSGFLKRTHYDMLNRHFLEFIEARAYIGPIDVEQLFPSVLTYHYTMTKHTVWKPEIYKEKQMYIDMKYWNLTLLLVCVFGKLDGDHDKELRSILDML